MKPDDLKTKISRLSGRDSGKLVIMRTVIGLMLLLATYSAGADSSSQVGFANLKKWIGHYPTPNDKSRPFFQQPEVKQILMKILPFDRLQLLTKGLEVESPIRQRNGYIQVKLCKAHDCPGENAALLLGLEKNDVIVVFYKGDPTFTNDGAKSTTCYSTGAQLASLPSSVKEDLLQMHHTITWDGSALLPSNSWIDTLACSTPANMPKLQHRKP
jgi:hypothetical protein